MRSAAGSKYLASIDGSASGQLTIIGAAQQWLFRRKEKGFACQQAANLRDFPPT
jgi:hypothetical protein